MHFPFIIIFISLALLQVQAGAQQISLQAPVRESNQNGEIGQIVETASGRVQGHASRSVEGVEEFLGIRYAKAPVGELRFAKPVEYRGSDEGEVFVAENYVRSVLVHPFSLSLSLHIHYRYKLTFPIVRVST